MKIKTIVSSFLALLVLGLTTSIAEAHSNEKKIAGPNGGRVLTKVEPHAEFFVTAERKVQITFLGEDGKAIAPAAQVVAVTAGDRAAPTKLSFAKSGDVLISDVALPAGNNFPAVVQIKATPDAKAVAEKFNVNLSQCGECDKAEYACTCAH
ncbi:hypothetical protein CMV30_13285 [Nibricoccus aquaticus]|uniref:Uncharacterized protein n=1 Tax=Nibricoccus aquaticus TaxID=2576891 RepID=A0A290QKJ3_9BACT|nr:hypothetical protein [Nibricoccus aquaticus]ATC64861.1 hypothetical protein CMV30_13285 [Nibricoccus aquaticus]